MKKEDFNNTCIYAKNEGDGKLIIEFYKSLGFDDKCVEGEADIYYGTGEYDYISYYSLYSLDCPKVLDFSVIEEYNKQDVPELTFPRMMAVWDDDNIYKGLVVAYCKDIDFPWIVANDDSKSTFKFTGYKNSSEIVPTDITQKEIEEKLGYSINIVK